MRLVRLMFVLTLIVLSSSARAMPIFIKLPSGGILTVEAEPSDSIQQIKQRIQDQQGFSPETQRLIFGSVQLEEGRTLADYGIPAEAMLHLLLPDMATSIPSLSGYGLAVLSVLLAGLGFVTYHCRLAS